MVISFPRAFPNAKNALLLQYYYIGIYKIISHYSNNLIQPFKPSRLPNDLLPY